ncbi:hypothetical protein E2C01_077844 [Portunus trituberculatus]|uniref:Uncharacterized protein n=1 Tax=Portunus trituberculatus TaxID=210409 RepID=A0A5B7IR02_PORTR|nr:hypothetical protein [Portunus trituberculatus]
MDTFLKPQFLPFLRYPSCRRLPSLFPFASFHCWSACDILPGEADPLDLTITDRSAQQRVFGRVG